MLDDDFVKNFLAEGPQPEKGPEEIPDKPLYTRAEVDEIVNKTIAATMDALQGKATDTPEESANEEKEVADNGSEEGDNGETE